MTNNKLEEGFTKLPNSLLDELCRIRINGQARQVLDVIVRKTYGWSKNSDWISLSQFMNMTGLSKSHVIRAIKKLLILNMITKKGNGKDAIYSVNRVYASWRPLPKKETLPKKKMTVSQKGNPGYSKKGTTKDTNTIDNPTRETVNALVDLYHEYCPSLLRWSKPTQARIKLVAQRLVERPNLNQWRNLFVRIEKSDFLTGRKNGFQAKLDWILNPTNLLKIEEGQYDNFKESVHSQQVGQVSESEGVINL